MPLSDYAKSDPHPKAWIVWAGEEMLSLEGAIHADEDAPVQVQNILEHHLPVWLDLFQMKSKEYGDAAFELGERAQFVDMSRKFVKLRTAIWEGEEEALTTESVDEILLDLIGHCFLTLEMRRRAGKQAPPSPPIFARTMSADIVLGERIETGPMVTGSPLPAGHPGYTEDTDQEDFASQISVRHSAQAEVEAFDWDDD